ncbi:uncharacterized protein LOC100905731 [Galendromus occidentalis]|uniref:Uncharacterized protein LOC100905731 n=1 Tax=Galendromus occidentalis TaxID=34638 RepID=A0AAJ7L6T9_9ACAR|nr:uncharacterized protein LOC100905731 [Galendromus occidentalis]
MRERIITKAHEAYKLLRGVVCVHKEAFRGGTRVTHELKAALASELNGMIPRPQEQRIEISGSFEEEKFQVVQRSSLADHVLVAGPLYDKSDISIVPLSLPLYMSSGLCLLGLAPKRDMFKLKTTPLVSTYEMKCVLGIMTDDGTTNGRIRERSRYHHVHQAIIERYLSSVQAGFQRQGFEYAGVDMDSQEAYELASKGLLRPQQPTMPLIYALRCTEFDAPSFTLEVQVINGDDVYLRTLVCDLALKLKTTAALDKMRRTRYGPFTLDMALIKHLYSVENVLDNIEEIRPTVDKLLYPNIFKVADSTEETLTVVPELRVAKCRGVHRPWTVLVISTLISASFVFRATTAQQCAESNRVNFPGFACCNDTLDSDSGWKLLCSTDGEIPTEPPEAEAATEPTEIDATDPNRLSKAVRVANGTTAQQQETVPTTEATRRDFAAGDPLSESNSLQPSGRPAPAASTETVEVGGDTEFPERNATTEPSTAPKDPNALLFPLEYPSANSIEMPPAFVTEAPAPSVPSQASTTSLPKTRSRRSAVGIDDFILSSEYEAVDPAVEIEYHKKPFGSSLKVGGRDERLVCLRGKFGESHLDI